MASAAEGDDRVQQLFRVHPDPAAAEHALPGSRAWLGVASETERDITSAPARAPRSTAGEASEVSTLDPAR